VGKTSAIERNHHSDQHLLAELVGFEFYFGDQLSQYSFDHGEISANACP
jgi:hypothetical protein